MSITRFGFGSGIYSPDMAGRSDIDGYHRACKELTNFELMPSGAIRRRKGSKQVVANVAGTVIAFKAVKASDLGVHLIVVTTTDVKVYSPEGRLEFSAGMPNGYDAVSLYQINDIVIILHPWRPPHVLQLWGGESMTLNTIRFKSLPLLKSNKTLPLFLASNAFAYVGGRDKKWDIYSDGAGTVYGAGVFRPGDTVAAKLNIAGGAGNVFSKESFLHQEWQVNTLTLWHKAGTVLHLAGEFLEPYKANIWYLDKDWPGGAQYASMTPDRYPEYFSQGLPSKTLRVNGVWTVKIRKTIPNCAYRVMASDNGIAWEDIAFLDDASSQSDYQVLTGKTDGLKFVRLHQQSFRDAAWSHNDDAKITVGNSTAWVYLRVKALFTSSAILDFEELQGIGFDNQTVTEWEKCAFGNTEGWPTACAVHNGRLCFAGVRTQPSSLFFSDTNDFYAHTQGVDDSHAMALTLSTIKYSKIEWLASSGIGLIIGTSDGEHLVRAGSNGGITNKNAQALRIGSTGSNRDTSIAYAPDGVFFIDRSAQRLRKVNYTGEAEFYTCMDLSTLSKGILTGGIIDMCFQSAPWPVAWMVPLSGGHANKLVGMLYLPEQQINAWFVWDVGSAVYFVDCAGDTSWVDKLFMVTSRNGVTCIDVIDWVDREQDAGQSTPFEARLVTTSLTPPDIVGGKYTGAQGALMLMPETTVYVGKADSRGENVYTAPDNEAAWLNCFSFTGSKREFFLEFTIKSGQGGILAAQINLKK